MKNKLNRANPQNWLNGRINLAKFYAMKESRLEAKQTSDDGSAIQDAIEYARRVRQRLGLTQQELSQRIDVSLDTIRNWEQGKRSPTGAAKALLRVLDRAPEAELGTLG